MKPSLKGNDILNQKVYDLLERCSQTNIVLKDNAGNARSLLNPIVQRNGPGLPEPQFHHN